MARGYLCEAAYYRKSPADTERQCLAAIDLSHVYPSNLSLKSLYHLHAILADTYKNALRKPELALDHLPRCWPSQALLPTSATSAARPRRISAGPERRWSTRTAPLLCVRPQDLAYIAEIRRKLNAPTRG
jgi:hypothetical protein